MTIKVFSFLALLIPVSSQAALVAHWAFEEGAGTTAANGANPSFNGTVAGGAAWVPGPAGFGNALSFDGADDQLDTTYSAVSGGGVRTVAAWIRYPNQPGASPDEFDAIVSYGNNTTSNRWTFRVSDAAAIGSYRLRLEVSGGGVNGGTLLNDDLWHHVAVVQTGNTLGSVLLYLDGVPETLTYNGSGAPLAINTVVGATTVRVGGSGHATNYNFKGSIDDVRIYDEALTQAQIQALMVPEPATTGLSGLLGLALLVRRRR